MNDVITLSYEFIQALEFASQCHRFQKRKDAKGTAYIHHPIQVMKILVDADVRSSDVLIAALLHDTVEDTGATLEELTIRFGKKISHYVKEVSDDKSLPKEVRKKKQVEHVPALSYGALLIKLADKISNLNDLCEYPPTWNTQRISEYILWCDEVVNGLSANVAIQLNVTEGDIYMSHYCYHSLVNTYSRVRSKAKIMYGL